MKQINTAKLACRSIDKIRDCWPTRQGAGDGPGLSLERMEMEDRKALVRRIHYFK